MSPTTALQIVKGKRRRRQPRDRRRGVVDLVAIGLDPDFTREYVAKLLQ